MSRRVLVTGGAGFIGVSLTRRLLAGGDRVIVFDDFSTGSREYLPDGVELVVGDVRDAGALVAACAGVDGIVHLAAHASVPRSISEPRLDFEVNVVGAFNALEAARTAGVRRFVFASSNATTGGANPVAAPDVPLRPVSPYGAAKAAGEVYGHAFSQAYGIDFIALRFSNVYGPFCLHKGSVVAAFLRGAIVAKQITIHGDGRQTRDLVHVDDIVAGIAAALEPDAIERDAIERDASGSRVYQIGSGRETSINELADALEAALGRRVGRVHTAPQPGDVRRNVSDISLATAELGYRAGVTLEDGLERTARWFEEALRHPELTGAVADAASGSE